MAELDELDLRILDLLQRSGRITVSKLSELLAKPRTTVASRIERLEKLGYIRGYRAEVDPEKLGYHYLAYVLIVVARTKSAGPKPLQIEIAEKILQDTEARDDLPWVEEAHIITGRFDILLKVWARSLSELDKFLVEYLPTIEGVVRTETMIVLRRVGERHYLPIRRGGSSEETG